MIDYILFTVPFIILWLTSRRCYQYSIRLFAKIKLSKLNQSLDKLYYSFEQVVYFYNQTTHIEAIKTMDKSHIHLRFEYHPFIFTELTGIYIELNNDKTITLAYLPIDQFMLPYLDQKMQEKALDYTSCKRISIAKLYHPDTKMKLVDEVFNQISFGRYSSS
ncbi:hypothetical protein GCM10012290_25370 [Halolactibacillus alkaliphilus]|uniref:Uncharacterized protein n=1 Tax=Halolactibacillus alkaliphilus TaxID=442899 RepID=A0A511X4X8_9BACI|nr:hypothetical protein [Halolactibacillus alkaliphilus]GEN57998.1 hypothetical protein HAL01_24620 [Halolactibacillus alkaliphilus]GGN76043.1 hypothetical protein GCM10012290_25370 [Halolactibacillus alkaliphilus]SFP10324.1 hypothetical protein SAMN05720591_1484 [Halolactibacillus alkaliphilus]